MLVTHKTRFLRILSYVFPSSLAFHAISSSAVERLALRREVARGVARVVAVLVAGKQPGVAEVHAARLAVRPLHVAPLPDAVSAEEAIRQIRQYSYPDDGLSTPLEGTFFGILKPP